MKHQNCRIFQRSLELIDVVRVVTEQLPPRFSFLADQLTRAAASITQNFSEGCGKRTRRDRRCYFDRAKGSANEVGAALAVGHRFGVIESAQHERGADIADHLAAMLTKYC